MICIDFLTVIVAALIYTLIQSFWFSSYLFGETWRKLNPGTVPVNRFLGFFGKLAVALLLSYFLSLIEVYVEASSFWDGVVVGFILWLGFVFTTQITKVLRDKSRFKSFLIENGFFLLGFVVLGIILAG